MPPGRVHENVRQGLALFVSARAELPREMQVASATCEVLQASYQSGARREGAHAEPDFPHPFRGHVDGDRDIERRKVDCCPGAQFVERLLPARRLAADAHLDEQLVGGEDGIVDSVGQVEFGEREDPFVSGKPCRPSSGRTRERCARSRSG